MYTFLEPVIDVKDKVRAKKFNFEDVEGLTRRQLEEHYKLYEGYVNKTNYIWNQLENIEDFEGSNTTFSPVRSLMLGQSYAVNGVKLHELYFENLGGSGKGICEETLKFIKRDFGSYERWEKFFKSAGMAMRGWVVLGIDSLDNKLHIYGLDAHDVGSIWNLCPILVLDVYEHAYMIDFGINRKKYLDVFMENINWEVVGDRIRRCLNSMN